MPAEAAEAVAAVWEAATRDEGADSDFTSVLKPLDGAAEVTVGPVGA